MTLQDKRDSLAAHLVDHLSRDCDVFCEWGVVDCNDRIITINGADGCTYTITVEASE
jgi:hypothetical protein